MPGKSLRREALSLISRFWSVMRREERIRLYSGGTTRNRWQSAYDLEDLV